MLVSVFVISGIISVLVNVSCVLVVVVVVVVVVVLTNFICLKQK